MTQTIRRDMQNKSGKNHHKVIPSRVLYQLNSVRTSGLFSSSNTPGLDRYRKWQHGTNTAQLLDEEHLNRGTKEMDGSRRGQTSTRSRVTQER